MQQDHDLLDALRTDLARRLLTAGFPIEIVTTGGTGTAEICAEFDDVTEVQPGSFVFMDTDYRNGILKAIWPVATRGKVQ